VEQEPPVPTRLSRAATISVASSGPSAAVVTPPPILRLAGRKRAANFCTAPRSAFPKGRLRRPKPQATRQSPADPPW
jgi:hypothetical protein